ncbi:GNAT family N-acetyltransferase [Limibaculum sp. FT325]|uniref:GNAT family N-acetyltransferase n=1 Tax=Thermohalobaculum sediminis TaxID=2939436 RepID=UPI0020BF9A06|nr:GNAT family protein [Limibaculum sediminis]MCL5778792.1 GNAT family N-acetyltransferase [Limibaculum sediminis]
MFLRRARNRPPEIGTGRLLLRPPRMGDYEGWARLRRESRAFLQPWEPAWARDHLTSRSFRNRVIWAERAIRLGEALPLMLFRIEDGAILGGLTLSNIRREPAQAGTLGYWIGAPYARAGYMTEALAALREHAFGEMDLSRLEAACLPDNLPSRKLLERCQFKYEGVAQAYLQIDGRWRNHVLYAALRPDRRGRVETQGR